MTPLPSDGTLKKIKELMIPQGELFKGEFSGMRSNNT
jgi:hypothetical protein